MSPEVLPFPKKEPTLDTPESAQECLNLAKLISEQTDVWRSRSHSPALRGRKLAGFIAGDSQPLGREPKDYLPETGFGGTKTHDEAIFLNDYEKRRYVLSDWVARDEIDSVPVANEAYGEYFTRLDQIVENPYVPEEFRIATTALKRLYILREQLALKVGRVETFDSSAFTELFNRLTDDLY